MDLVSFETLTTKLTTTMLNVTTVFQESKTINVTIVCATEQSSKKIDLVTSTKQQQLVW